MCVFLRELADPFGGGEGVATDALRLPHCLLPYRVGVGAGFGHELFGLSPRIFGGDGGQRAVELGFELFGVRGQRVEHALGAVQALRQFGGFGAGSCRGVDELVALGLELPERAFE